MNNIEKCKKFEFFEFHQKMCTLYAQPIKFSVTGLSTNWNFGNSWILYSKHHL